MTKKITGEKRDASIINFTVFAQSQVSELIGFFLKI